MLTDSSSKIIQPINMTIELMEHQKTVISAMQNLEQKRSVMANGITQYHDDKDFLIKTNIGISGDRVGAGKSLMIVSLINLNKHIKISHIPFYSSNSFTLFEKNPTQVLTNLLIIPHKIVSQWEQFFKCAPTLKIGYYISIKDQKTISINTIKQYDVMVISDTKLQQFISAFDNNILWNRIIIDEADTITLPKNYNLKSSFTWFITGTPHGVRYSRKPYMANIFKNIIPWVFNY